VLELGAQARRSRRGRLRTLDAVTLCAIAAVVLLVSLPRLREFALRENQSDAQVLVARLGEQLEAREDGARADDVASLIEETHALSRQLEDAHFLEGGRLLERHGYLFELRRDGGLTAVRAWPSKYRQTGLAAFCWTVGSGLSIDANESGRWSGRESPPPLVLADAR
jgi:hypothetical protein